DRRLALRVTAPGRRRNIAKIPEVSMRPRLALLVLLLLPAEAGFARPPPASAAADTPVRVAYYYKVRWGFQQEFERLFLKNHYPVLMEMKQRGRVQDVK